MSEKHRIYTVLKDYQAGKIGRRDAMERLDLDYVFDLQALLVEFQMNGAAAQQHAPESASALTEYFNHG